MKLLKKWLLIIFMQQKKEQLNRSHADIMLSAKNKTVHVKIDCGRSESHSIKQNIQSELLANQIQCQEERRKLIAKEQQIKRKEKSIKKAILQPMTKQTGINAKIAKQKSVKKQINNKVEDKQKIIQKANLTFANKDDTIEFIKNNKSQNQKNNFIQIESEDQNFQHQLVENKNQRNLLSLNPPIINLLIIDQKNKILQQKAKENVLQYSYTNQVMIKKLQQSEYKDPYVNLQQQIQELRQKILTMEQNAYKTNRMFVQQKLKNQHDKSNVPTNFVEQSKIQINLKSSQNIYQQAHIKPKQIQMSTKQPTKMLFSQTKAFINNNEIQNYNQIVQNNVQIFLQQSMTNKLQHKEFFYINNQIVQPITAIQQKQTSFQQIHMKDNNTQVQKTLNLNSFLVNIEIRVKKETKQQEIQCKIYQEKQDKQIQTIFIERLQKQNAFLMQEQTNNQKELKQSKQQIIELKQKISLLETRIIQISETRPQINNQKENDNVVFFGKIKRNSLEKPYPEQIQYQRSIKHRQLVKVNDHLAIQSLKQNKIIEQFSDVFKDQSQAQSLQQKMLPTPLPKLGSKSRPPNIINQTVLSRKNATQIKEMKQRTQKTKMLLKNFDEIESQIKKQASLVVCNKKQADIQMMNNNPQINIHKKMFQLGRPNTSNNTLHLKGLIAKKSNVSNQQTQRNKSKSVYLNQQSGTQSPFNGGKKIFQFQFTTKSTKPIQFLQQQYLKQVKFPECPTFSEQHILQMPTPPQPNISLQNMMQLIIQLCSLIKNKVQIDQLRKLILKRFRNCIFFSLPQKDIKILWHYSGKIYIGSWAQQKNEKNGEGLEIDPSKYMYRGQFLNGKRNGKGILIYANGNKYEGNWLDGEKEGKGKSYDVQTNTYYVGDWKQGKKQGFGMLRISETQFYEGMFMDNCREGHGFEVFKNKDTYKGEYIKGKFNGKGQYKWADGSYYQGNFVQGQRDGFGRWRSVKAKQLYVGMYTKDKKNGNGKYVWQNGCVYEGQFQDDKKHGQGLVCYPDGRQMTGVWAYGQLLEVVNKIKQSNQEEPLAQKSGTLSKTKISVIDKYC